jgi:hypothetical protein
MVSCPWGFFYRQIGLHVSSLATAKAYSSKFITTFTAVHGHPPGPTVKSSANTDDAKPTLGPNGAALS